MAAGLALYASQAAEADVALVTDATTRSVVAIDPATNTGKEAVTIPGAPNPRAPFGDAVIAPDGGKGFVANSTNGIWVADLTEAAPRSAAGRNPIMLSAPAQKFARLEDDRLIAVTGDLSQKLLVIDVTTHAEAGDATTTKIVSAEHRKTRSARSRHLYFDSRDHAGPSDLLPARKYNAENPRPPAGIHTEPKPFS